MPVRHRIIFDTSAINRLEDIKAGDVILAINDHYLFTIGELKDAISYHEPGTKIAVRYRRYSTIYDASVVVGRVQ